MNRDGQTNTEYLLAPDQTEHFIETMLAAAHNSGPTQDLDLVPFAQLVSDLFARHLGPDGPLQYDDLYRAVCEFRENTTPKHSL